ncbi:hamartin [Holotrichia oblita]|uniref:Hamartin n=1 Tax=Holotrichia oblita TaxID=644536 RepID=A0ACB9TR54_HOLOL|nr:hamartin [Holotrichia oblita]
MADLLSNLESSDPQLVEESKLKLHEQFNAIKEPWLVNGLYDTYLSSNSTRLMEVLVNVKEPHYTYLFDKISESIKCSKDERDEKKRIQGLSLLGHIVRSEPAWVYKITNHSLMKELLKLLKTETDILTLLSALMALIVLLPLIPSLMANYLQDVFDIFCRLAGWNCHETGKMHEEQMTHMQVALYALFLRLYGMYPCNFLAYLRDQYRNKNLIPIFCHTIKPMLDTVKMHPHLVTTSKANETSTDRWKKMGAHDVIVECERFSLDLPERCSHEQCFISTCRPKSTTSILNLENTNQLQTLKILPSNALANDGEFFSPSMILYCATPPVNEKSLSTPIPFAQLPSNVQTTLISSVTQISQESSSPPEAAIEATPETTPVRDNRMNMRVPPANSTIARAHTFAARVKPLNSGHNTPINSQPSSPMRKEVSPFNFQDIPRHSSNFGNVKREPVNRLQKLIQDRSQLADPNVRSSFMLVPTSPSKGFSEIIVPGSPIPMQRLDSPLSQEDEEVSQIVRQGETIQYPGIRQCDSVLHEVEGFRGNDDDVDNCEQEHGSPCTEGGLHMPNSKSINDLTIRIRRLRYHSQCADDSDKYERSTGSSPGNAISYPNNISVRRANSCPEMKKSPVVSGKDNMNDKTLLETDEDGGVDQQDSKPMANGIDATSVGNRKKREKEICLKTIETQTENLWPMPYDHLFPSVFPSLESNETAPLIKKQEKPQCANIYDISDKYIDLSVHTSERELVNYLKNQIELLKLQLHFEKHRREMHAVKNRRLLADTRNTRALEEHKEALMDTVRMKQIDIESLNEQLEVLRKEKHCKEKEALDNAKFWDQQYKILQNECRKLKEKNEDYQKELESLRAQNVKLDSKWQDSESNLLNAITEVKIAKEQADAGEKGRIELEHVNKELLLLGELQLKYQERLQDLALSKRSDIEQKRLFDIHKHDMQVLTQQLEGKKKNLEACGTRITELEGVIQKHDDFCAVQKRQLNDVKEEYHEKLKAVESKYQTQLAINRCLEEKIVELWQRIEILNKKVISPDISSCHEVNATLTSTTQGLSSQSSPLSASLASSEGSMASTISEVKNLQKIVDQKDDNE